MRRFTSFIRIKEKSKTIHPQNRRHPPRNSGTTPFSLIYGGSPKYAEALKQAAFMRQVLSGQSRSRSVNVRNQERLHGLRTHPLRLTNANRFRQTPSLRIRPRSAFNLSNSSTRKIHSSRHIPRASFDAPKKRNMHGGLGRRRYLKPHPFIAISKPRGKTPLIGPNPDRFPLRRIELQLASDQG
jgi:hypothetical protein